MLMTRHCSMSARLSHKVVCASPFVLFPRAAVRPPPVVATDQFAIGPSTDPAEFAHAGWGSAGLRPIRPGRSVSSGWSSF